MSTPPTLQGIPLGDLRLGAPLSGGAGSGAWSATTGTGVPVVVRVLPTVDPDRDAARARRLEAVRTISHRGLMTLLPTPVGADDRLLIGARVDGPDLATVRTARLGITAAESLSIARDVAGALAELHAYGIAHGDVAPGNIVLAETDDDAVPVLVDLVGDLAWEAGTPGFVAPEVRAGHAPGMAADVWSTATLAVWAAQVGERDVVTRALGRALADDPEDRPSAAELARALTGQTLSPVRVPPPSVLAGATLREQAQRAATLARPSRRRRARHRRTPVARWVALALLVLVGLSGGVAAWAALREDQPPSAGPEAPDLVPRLQELVALRDAALVAGDAEALAALTVAGSSAQQQDLDLLAALQEDGARIDGLTTTLSEPRVVASGTGTAQVQAMLAQSGYDRTRGSTTEHVAATQPRCVELGLRLVEGIWLVQTAGGCG